VSRLILRGFDIENSVMPKHDPSWRFALGASPVTEGLILRLTAEDGVAGYGYAASSPHMGSMPSTMRAELEFFRQFVVGRDAQQIAAIMTDLDHRFRGAPQAKAAIDCALHDLSARALGVPLNILFGGPVRSAVPILRILAIKSPEEMAAVAQKLVDGGVRFLKIKVHGDVAEDVARVRAIRKQVGNDVHLTVDANQSYDPKSAITAINRMAEFDIDLVEQPVAANDNEGLALVTRMVPLTIEADEAAGSLEQVFFLASRRICDAVSLKIPKLGGLRNTMAAARICEAAGIRYRFGATVGSRLMVAHALHLACALPGVDYACEFGEFDRLDGDLFEGIEVRNGEIRLPAGPGTGVHPAAPKP
jgi:L-alanine-DL-glutamate epimerase-like enolase superfamily enzyme